MGGQFPLAKKDLLPDQSHANGIQGQEMKPSENKYNYVFGFDTN